MARKYITREITKTTVKVAKMEVKDGNPVAVPLEDETCYFLTLNKPDASLVNEKVGKKLYITGKGRCNVCNNTSCGDGVLCYY